MMLTLLSYVVCELDARGRGWHHCVVGRRCAKVIKGKKPRVANAGNRQPKMRDTKT